MPFTKLDRNFCESSILAHGPEVAGIWAYLLAAAGSTGSVTATVPAMAGVFRTSEERIMSLLEILAQPDPWSRTPENDGRRIRIERDPEWQIVLLNHGKYRKKEHHRDEAARREYMRKYMREKREAQHVSQNVSPLKLTLASVSLEAEAYTEAERTDNRLRPSAGVNKAVNSQVNSAPKPASKGRPTWLTPFGEDWTQAYGGNPPWGEMAKVLQGPVAELGADELRVRWRLYLGQTEGRYASPTRFAQTVGVWTAEAIARAKPQDIRSMTVGDFNAATYDRVMARLNAKEAGREGQGALNSRPAEARRVLPSKTE